MESLRKQDMYAEKILGEFMDKSFYSRLHDKKGNKIKFERIKDEERQLDGIDVVIEVNGKKYLIDEKATIYYSNLMIPTFAFEIDFLQKNSNKLIDGWLINDTLETEYYMLIWPNVKCISVGKKYERISIQNLKVNDFTIVEAMLIKKQKVLNYLEAKLWDVPRIKQYAKVLREAKKNSNDNSKIMLENIDDFYFYFSGKLAEKPINIVMKKDVLRELAEASYFISREGYGVIKNI